MAMAGIARYLITLEAGGLQDSSINTSSILMWARYVNRQFNRQGSGRMAADMQLPCDDELASPHRRAFFRRFAPDSQQIVPESVYPRPPWALSSKLFLALCTQCDRCIDQCPMRVLGKSDETSEILVGRPILDLAHGRCNFCGQCVDNCPTGALSREQGVKKQVAPQLVSSCQLELDMYCHFCQEACPELAIEYVDKKPVINSDRCTGCGECALDCYSRVLVMTKA